MSSRSSRGSSLRSYPSSQGCPAYASTSNFHSYGKKSANNRHVYTGSLTGGILTLPCRLHAQSAHSRPYPQSGYASYHYESYSSSCECAGKHSPGHLSLLFYRWLRLSRCFGVRVSAQVVNFGLAHPHNYSLFMTIPTLASDTSRTRTT